MGFQPDQLRDKALAALEEVVQECRYRRPRRSLALRLALAYLWTHSRSGRVPFDTFWRVLDEDSLWRFQGADRALTAICSAIGVERNDELAMRLWQARLEEEARSGARGPGPPC